MLAYKFKVYGLLITQYFLVMAFAYVIGMIFGKKINKLTIERTFDNILNNDR